ncbi:MAG TPA: glycosyltransferase family 2 protein [Candidatus Polarisedimenticolia bacterium]|nr:glycosyltransferase family 2 protein [Candidatus Polarisedimenticolia bacterium]
MTSMAEWLFWGCAGMTAYSYAGYPVLLTLWTSLRGETPEDEAPGDRPLPRLSLIVPAYNEEQVIARKIRNSLELDYPEALLEIVVVSDGSSDATESVARAAAGGRVRLVFLENRRGKTACLNAVLPDLRGEILVFTDANAYFRADALRNLVRRFQDPRIGCVMGQLEYFREGPLNASLGEGLYWRYENFIKDRESRLGSTIVGNGAIYAMRRVLCAPLPERVEADVANPLLALRGGYRVVFERAARCQERAASTVREEFCRKTRIITNQITTYLHGARCFSPLPAMAWFQIISHKVLRWMVPLFLTGIFVACLAGGGGPFWSSLLGLQALFYAMALAGWILESRGRALPKQIFLPYYFCAVNAASVKGIADFLRGRHPVVWEKAASTR